MDDADLARTDLTREDARRIWSAQPVKVKTKPYSNMVQPPAAPPPPTQHGPRYDVCVPTDCRLPPRCSRGLCRSARLRWTDSRHVLRGCATSATQVRTDSRHVLRGCAITAMD